MVTYIVTETREKYGRSGFHATRVKLEKASGQPCLSQYFADVAAEGSKVVANFFRIAGGGDRRTP